MLNIPLQNTIEYRSGPCLNFRIFKSCLGGHKKAPTSNYINLLFGSQIAKPWFVGQ